MLVPQSPASTTSSAKLRRDTGFPEPFCGTRNTTLPHPDADISPNACISAEDVDPSRTVRRSRKRRYRHTLAHGKITVESSESLHRTATASTGDGDEDQLAPMHCVMLPDGRVSNDMSFEEALANYSASRSDEDESRKKNLLKRILGH